MMQFSSDKIDVVNNKHESRFEAETVAFHEKVRAGYLELARLEPDRIRIIDAAQTHDQVFADISKILSSSMNKS